MESYSVCFFGDSGVGKTSLIRRIADPDGEEWRRELSTVSAEFQKILARGERGDVDIIIWDLPGQATYQNILPIYLRRAQAVVIVFDLTCRTTFDNVKNWKAFMSQHIAPIPIVLVGNKSDLTSARVVSDADALDICQEIGAEPYFITSALTGEAVANLADRIRAMALEIRTSASVDIVSPEPVPLNHPPAKQCGC
jgi:small GTP-binding protein